MTADSSAVTTGPGDPNQQISDLPMGSESAKSAEKTTRSWGKRLELAWIWSIIGYSVLRFVVAWGAFTEHGANIWVFGLIDIGTAWPYAKSVAVLTSRIAAGERRRTLAPAVIAVVTFMAPYLYLWVAARTMPQGIRTALVLAVTVLALSACAGIWLRSRKAAGELRARDGDSNFPSSRSGSGDSLPDSWPVLDSRSELGSAAGQRGLAVGDHEAAVGGQDVVIDVRSEPAAVQADNQDLDWVDPQSNESVPSAVRYRSE